MYGSRGFGSVFVYSDHSLGSRSSRRSALALLSSNWPNNWRPFKTQPDIYQAVSKLLWGSFETRLLLVHPSLEDRESRQVMQMHKSEVDRSLPLNFIHRSYEHDGPDVINWFVYDPVEFS